MNIAKQNIDDLNAVITLTLDKNDYEPKVNSVLNNYRKKASIPGFRPGKVPVSLINKMYGKSALVEEVNKLVSENLSTFITENKLELLGEPLPSEKQSLIDFDTHDSFNFVFDIAIAPEIDVNLSTKDKHTYYNIAITDELMDQQIKSVTGRFGKNEQVEAVSDKSMVKGTFNELDGQGNIVEGGIWSENAVISMMVIKDEATKKQLLGSKVDSSITIDPKTTFPSDTEIAYILKISKEEAADLTSKFKFTVKEINEFANAPLSQDLFDQLYGQGVVNSDEEFIAKIKEDFQKTLTLETDYRFTLDVREKLVSTIKFDLPEAFLTRWLKATNRENEQLTEENLQKELPKFFIDLRWQLIKNNIIKSNDIKIEHADILATAKKAARIQFMQYGLNNIPEDYLESYANDMLSKEEQRSHYVENAVNDKVIEHLKTTLNLDKKEISREDFNKLFDKN